MKLETSAKAIKKFFNRWLEFTTLDIKSWESVKADLESQRLVVDFLREDLRKAKAQIDFCRKKIRVLTQAKKNNEKSFDIID
jgi:hypothetical protein